MALPEHERPLSDHERRALAEIESGLATAIQYRRRRRRLAVCRIAILALCIGAAVVVAVTALALLPAAPAALVTGLLGTLIGGLTVHTWAQNHDHQPVRKTGSRR